MIAVRAFDRFKNPDGTYNGTAAFASLTGIPPAELAWTAKRLMHLMKVDGKGKDEAKAIVATEAKGRPWERAG